MLSRWRSLRRKRKKQKLYDRYYPDFQRLRLQVAIGVGDGSHMGSFMLMDPPREIDPNTHTARIPVHFIWGEDAEMSIPMTDHLEQQLESVRAFARDYLPKPDPALADLLPGKASGHTIGFRVWEVTQSEHEMEIDASTGEESPVADALRIESRGRIWPIGIAMPCARGTPGYFAVNEYLMFRRIKPEHVVGLVALWGDVRVHEKGYRAAYAYPFAMCEGEHAQAIAKNYGVPMMTRKAAQTFL